MSFSDLFDSGFKQRNKDHFAAIVRVAMGDGIISDDEKAFLNRLAQNLEISEEVYTQILKDFHTHPINPPSTQEQRIERLFDLARMVYADNIKDQNEVKLLTKIAVGLGYTDNTDIIVSRALKAISEGHTNFDDFKAEVLG